MNASCYIARFVVTATLGIIAVPIVNAEENNRAAECDLQLRVEFSDTEVESFAPILARVELFNAGSSPRTIAVQENGCPYALSVTAVSPDGSEAEHSLWLSRNGPRHNDIVLRPGDSATGEILVLLSYGDDFVFTTPGRYATRWSWRSSECTAVRSADARVNVVRLSEVNATFLGAIEKAALDYFVGEPEHPIDWDDQEVRREIRRQAGRRGSTPRSQVTRTGERAST